MFDTDTLSLTSTSSSVSPRHFFHRSQPLFAILQLSLSRLTPSAAWLPLLYPFTLQPRLEPSSHGPALVRVQQISSSGIRKNEKKKGERGRGKKIIFSDEVQGSIPQEARHFHLGAKWFWGALHFPCFNVKRLRSVRFVYFYISKDLSFKRFWWRLVKPQLFVCHLVNLFIQTSFSYCECILCSLSMAEYPTFFHCII